MLFMDFVTPSRLRVQGDAQLTDDPAIVGLWPGAQFAVKVAITALITLFFAQAASATSRACSACQVQATCRM
jgi:hypothetical protein